ncbi:helix-turn-helix domain-containing protein [Actinoplanes hulinensis]|uniref:Helix-turn-helix domain-containing protein n=1 Tax=Actinoplanes hulinensis TaxID=1144547 RepID=A0ABS7B2M9_9ACTN|nr:helix-turn-helix transcriptional regulator [Actinoplanes hulinensis]MBW6435117.1 helix-turn-helix domain-containing protein [Actinoplanes hulinensis]
MTEFAGELRRLRDQRGLSYRQLAALSTVSSSQISDLEKGQRRPTREIAAALDRALDARGRLVTRLRTPAPDDVEGEFEALELAQRAAASDVSDTILDRLDGIADRMAMSYATTPPAELLPKVRRHLRYIDQLLAGRTTLQQHRRLLVAGGWLSLLRATLHIDLQQRATAAAHLSTAAALADQAEHPEIAAWCLETQAWDHLTRGGHRRAVELSRHAQAIAPASGSAIVQATAQEGRAWARLGDQGAMRDALGRVERMAEHRPTPEHPEHHYQYDPGKMHAYTATTLSWAGDPAAERVAREVLAELEAEGARPRRIASARLDLGLALLSGPQGRPDEAAAEARTAIESGRIVPSNWWRVDELVGGVLDSGAPEGRELSERAEAARPGVAD